MNLTITTLIENNPDKNNILISEHGLSLYIESGKTKILFDTGKSGAFIKNAEKLKVNLNDLNYVILSHGHYDHSGGFIKLIENIDNIPKLIVGNGFFNKKYKLVEENKYKFNGNDFDKRFIDKNNISTKYIDNDFFEVTKDIIVFSNFEKSTDFESANKKFYVKKDEQYVEDNFSDEIVLGIKHEKGLCVILGCSHIGIVNILKTIIKKTNMNIYGVIGGSHLIDTDELRLNSTIDFFKENNIEILGLSHCTSENAMKKIQNKFQNKFIYNNTGNVIKII